MPSIRPLLPHFVDMIVPCPAQAPSEVKGKPVDDIINEWNAELERRSRSFVRHAEALAQVRAVLLRLRRALVGRALPALANQAR